MNTKDFTYLLNKPYSLTERQLPELEQILLDFPFLQSARAIQLKGLYNQDSFRYNTELKKTAAHTTDRSVLFDFITSEQFHSVQKGFFEESEKAIAQISVTGSEVVQPGANKLEESIRLTIKAVQVPEELPAPADIVKETEQSAPLPIENQEVTSIEVENDNDNRISGNTEANSAAPALKRVEEKLEIGKPLDFVKSEKHSFQEWLQLSKLAPVNREEEAPPLKEEVVQDESKIKKLELIDKFIETNPKIVGDRSNPPSPVNIDRSTQDTSYLMTETLARVYLEQKKYSKAIQAYQILILKYPEKSVFFADRISDIKNLQQNNN